MNRLFEFVKDQYAWEAARRDKLNSSSSIPIGIATIAGTTTATILSKIQPPFDIFEFVVAGFLTISILIGSNFAYQTFRFFRGPIYKYVANSELVKNYHGKSVEYFKKNPREGDAAEDFDDFLIATLSKCATVNCENNDQKSKRLYAMNQAVLLMMLPCLLAGLLLAFQPLISGTTQPQKVLMSKNDNDQKPPPPPERPRERDVKDGANSPRPQQR